MELILDASGSMFNKLADGRYRIVAAKDVLAELVAALPASDDLHVGYRAYGSELQATAAGSCEDSRLFVPIEGVKRQLLLDTVRNTQARGATPIAYSLERALEDLQGRAGKRIVVLITDGEEGCGGDVRAAAQALRDAGIDLRIIGFDLGAAAVASFEGIGVFENATSAAELLAALNRAVAEAAAPATAPATYPVTVTLTRAGAPAADGPVVDFVPALGDGTDAERFGPHGNSANAFRTELPAGAYTARVADAFSAAPLTVSGLVVTPEGPNEFTFDLEPGLPVTLTPEATTPGAGSTLRIAWEGAPDVENGYIALTPADVDSVLLYIHAPGAAGEGDMRLPIVPGDYDLRFQVDHPSGATELLGVARISLQEVSVSLSAPAEVIAGGAVEIDWVGPDNQYDYITIVPVGTPQGIYGAYAETQWGNPSELRAPESVGEFEIRYMDGSSDVTLASIPIKTTKAEVAFTAPRQAVAGSRIVLTVTVPSPHDGDYISIVPVGTPAGEWDMYAYIGGPGEYELDTRDVAGEYELRYDTNSEGRTLAMIPITLTEPAPVTLVTPDVVGAGEMFDVQWEGPDNPGDLITIVPAGAPAGEWGYSLNTSDGSPLWLQAPEEPGAYEVRYLSNWSSFTLGSRPITVR